MAPKNKPAKTQQKPPVQKKGGQQTQTTRPKKNAQTLLTGSSKKNRWVIPFILLITLIAFIPALKAGFVNWDDGDYVYENVFIRDWSYLKTLLTTPVQGNHHPLTMLSLAFNYQISGNDAWSYHLVNLLLHLVNCLLVFRFAMLLSNRNMIIAFTTAVLFGVHPMHVESVAWVSERKDVLYGLFFIAGLISYTKYLDSDSKKDYLLAVLFLFLSLLSKPAAVIFPVVLFCLDILRKRKFSFKIITEKIPFFVFSFIFGVLTVVAQKEAGATGTTGTEEFSMGWLILFGFYGIMMYVVKLIIPFSLSPFYPFPPINESLPLAYYIAPIFFIALICLVYYSWKRNRVIAFGILFYIANLLLVLQVFSVGSAVIAERYTYIPYIGLFYIIGWFIDRYAKADTVRASYVIVPVSILLALLTYQQSAVWTDGQSLWTHTLKTNPSSRAYSALGVLARKEKNNEKALEYYNQAIKMNAIDHESYNNRGNIYLEQKKYDLAFENFRKSLQIKPDYYTALDNMGAAFAMQGQHDSALKYSSMALKTKPDYKQAYSNRALTLMALKNYEDAIKDWKAYLKYDPEAADIYNTIGLCFRLLGQYDSALLYINKSIIMGPQPEFYMNRSYTNYTINKKEEATRDAQKAREGGVVLEEWYAKLLGL